MTISRGINKYPRTFLHGLWSATSIELHIIEREDCSWSERMPGEVPSFAIPSNG